MPELPEVETIVRGLQSRISGRKIVGLKVLNSGSFQLDKEQITEVILEHKISSIWRRAKVMIWDLASGYSLLFHLKMTGQIIYEPAVINETDNRQRTTDKQLPSKFRTANISSQMINDKREMTNEASDARFAGGHPTSSLNPGANLPDSSTRVIFALDDGSNLYFNDQRKFGWIRLLATKQVHSDEFLISVGPEHDEDAFTPKYLWQKLRNRITPVKALLLDQKIVAGIGNIYADEALHLAKIHPARKASSLSKSEVSALFNAISAVLADGIKYGGTSFDKYVNESGGFGSYLKHARVFRRQGQACKVCGQTIIKTKVAGRGTHYCPHCQPPPARWRP